jgi:hypothetical protein
VVVLAVACTPAGRTYCGCDAPTAEEVAVLDAEAAQAAEAAKPIVGERVVVSDGALGTTWRAVEPGVAGFRASRGVAFDEHAKEAFRYFFAVEAERPDTGESRSIEIAVTFVPKDGAVHPVALELTEVGPDKTKGGAATTRAFWACPEGATIHHARWSPGDSPCHKKALAPIVRCGCDDYDRTDPKDCADFERTAVKKTACIRQEGGPVPP